MKNINYQMKSEKSSSVASYYNSLSGYSSSLSSHSDYELSAFMSGQGNYEEFSFFDNNF